MYEDLYHGKEYLDAVARGDITEDDVVIFGSIDGAQLYRNKASDCWIGITIIGDVGPTKRYKKARVMPSFFIGGPNKPKHVDSFMYPSVHHLSALQRDNFCVWNAATNRVYRSRPFLLLETADGPGLTYLNGLVGHHGAYGCRLHCGLKGRRKEGGSTYYPVMAKPHNYSVEGSDHDDVNVRTIPPASETKYLKDLDSVILSRNAADYRARRKSTGISKPSIFLGLPRRRMLGVPGLFSSDIMHWASLNWTDLVLALFRGTIECELPDTKTTWDWAVLTGDTWKDHGQKVADATPYLPGSFDRPPRNPAEKISSGYKAWEFLMYIIGLAPALLHGIVPDIYWAHFCKGVSVIRCFHQHKIPRVQLVEAHTRALSYATEFETLYYQQMPERIHFVRQSIHGMVHLAPETIRIGPQACYAQWTMERTIGNLGEELKQDSNPYTNLSERGSRRVQVNCLTAMAPELDHTHINNPPAPRGSKDLGEGYVLLRARDEYAHRVSGDAAAAIRMFLKAETTDGDIKLKRWARLRLPNGQIARSAWKERQKPLKKVRMARNVKASHLIFCRCHSFKPLHQHGRDDIAEIEYFFCTKDGPALALASFYSRPDPQLLQASYSTVWSCTGPTQFTVIKVKDIHSVVAMVPHMYNGSARFFLVEKPGLDMITLSGYQEDADAGGQDV